MILEAYDGVSGDSLNEQELATAAIRGMARSLDPHSHYYSRRDAALYWSPSNDEVGIGVILKHAPRTGDLTIVHAHPDGPAVEAGLQTLDRVLMIEDHPVRDEPVGVLAARRLRGRAGSEVTLLVDREAWSRPRFFSIERRRNSAQHVESSHLPGDIGYIRLPPQIGGTFEEFEHIMTTESAHWQAVILDLRSSPGGNMAQIVQIAGSFLGSEDVLASVQGRGISAEQQDVRAEHTSEHYDLPLVVLVSGTTAGAAEILAGSLSRMSRALVVGTQTFGQGSIQAVLPLESSQGDAFLRLTVGRYYFPDGTTFDGSGVEPDYVVAAEGQHQPGELLGDAQLREGARRAVELAGGQPSEYPEYTED